MRDELQSVVVVDAVLGGGALESLPPNFLQIALEHFALRVGTDVVVAVAFAAARWRRPIQTFCKEQLLATRGMDKQK